MIVSKHHDPQTSTVHSRPESYQARRAIPRIARIGFLQQRLRHCDILNQVVSREPSPEFAAEVAEQYEVLIRSLGNAELTQLALWKMEGFSNQEIT